MIRNTEKKGAMESLCFSVLPAVKFGSWKTLLFHTPKHRVFLLPSVSSLRYQIEITQKKNHLLSGFVWQSVGLYRSFYDRGG